MEGMTICDPACGVGKFPLEFIKEHLPTLFKIKEGKIIPKITLVGFDKGFDKEEQRTIILAKANMLIYFCELIKEHMGATKEFAQLFNASFQLKTNSILGTLAAPAQEEYDLILTNPPYVTSGSSNLKEEIAKHTALRNYYKINAMGVEGLFVEWIIQALKKGGKAFVVLPDGVFTRKNDHKLRRYIAETCCIDAVVSLPTKTFFTTPKKTYILAITKKNDIAAVQTDPVFTYLCSEIGESRDVYRFDMAQDDLTEAVDLFNSFKGNKKGFAKLHQDKRCKIQPADRFLHNVDKEWLIEKDWSEEEKIQLGIEENKKKATPQEFSQLLRDTAAMINQYAGLLEKGSGGVKLEDRAAKHIYIDITNTEYFRLKRGKRITRRTINLNKGTVPVYSSSKDAHSPLGYVAKDFLKRNGLVLCNHPSILFNLDGSVGHCFIRNDKEYSFIDVVASLTPLQSTLDIAYVFYELRNAILKTRANYNSKLYFNKIKLYKISIPFPVNSSGAIDLHQQKELVKKYRLLEKAKSNIKEKLEQIAHIRVTM